MLTPEQRHKHSWLNWDWEKIKYRDIDWIPVFGKEKFLWNFTITGTGNIAVTGVWFTPKLVRFTVGSGSGNPAETWVWAMTTTTQQSMNNANSTQNTTKCIYFWNPLIARAYYISMDLDWFTINCDYFSANAYVNFECE